MNVSRFTVPELEYFRAYCNFIGEERTVFDLRSQGVPLEEIAEKLNYTYDGIKKVSRRINDKISRVNF
jgi:transcriptional regulator